MSQLLNRPIVSQAIPRRISTTEEGHYLNNIIPGIYAEVYGLPENVRRQVIDIVQDEIQRWKVLNQSEIDRRVAEGYKYAR